MSNIGNERKSGAVVHSFTEGFPSLMTLIVHFFDLSAVILLCAITFLSFVSFFCVSEEPVFGLLPDCGEVQLF